MNVNQHGKILIEFIEAVEDNKVFIKESDNNYEYKRRDWFF